MDTLAPFGLDTLTEGTSVRIYRCIYRLHLFIDLSKSHIHIRSTIAARHTRRGRLEKSRPELRRRVQCKGSCRLGPILKIGGITTLALLLLLSHSAALMPITDTFLPPSLHCLARLASGYPTATTHLSAPPFSFSALPAAVPCLLPLPTSQNSPPLRSLSPHIRSSPRKAAADAARYAAAGAILLLLCRSLLP
jgi:hypothetical protein